MREAGGKGKGKGGGEDEEVLEVGLLLLGKGDEGEKEGAIREKAGIQEIEGEKEEMRRREVQEGGKGSCLRALLRWAKPRSLSLD